MVLDAALSELQAAVDELESLQPCATCGGAAPAGGAPVSSVRARLLKVMEELQRERAAGGGSSSPLFAATTWEPKTFRTGSDAGGGGARVRIRRVRFSDDVLQAHDDKAVGRVLMTQKKRRELAATEFAWLGKGLRPRLTEWMESAFRPAWSVSSTEARLSAAQVLQRSEVSLEEGLAHPLDDDAPGHRSSLIQMLFLSPTERARLATAREELAVRALAALPPDSDKDSNSTSSFSALVVYVSEVVATAFDLLFTGVDRSRVRAFVSSWLHHFSPVVSACSAPISSSGQHPWPSLVIALEQLRFVAVSLATCRANHELFYSSFSADEIAAALFSAMALPTIAFPGATAAFPHTLVAMLFSDVSEAGEERYTQERMSVFCAAAALLDDHSNFVLPLLDPAVALRISSPAESVSSADTLHARKTFLAFFSLTLSISQSGSTRAHSDLIKHIHQSTVAQSAREQSAHRRGFLAATVHLAATGAPYFRGPPVECVVLLERLVRHGVHPTVGLLLTEQPAHAPAMVAGAEKLALMEGIEAICEAQCAVIKHVVEPLLELVTEKFFSEVVFGGGDDSDEGSDLLLPRKWLASLRENLTYFESLSPAAAQKQFGGAVEAARCFMGRPPGGRAAVNNAPIAVALMRSDGDPLSILTSLCDPRAHEHTSADHESAPEALIETLVKTFPLVNSSSQLQDLASLSRTTHSHYIVSRYFEHVVSLSWTEGARLSAAGAIPPVRHHDMLQAAAAMWLHGLVEVQTTWRPEPPFVCHLSQVDQHRALEGVALRLHFSDARKCLEWCALLAHLPPPHPEQSLRHYLDPVVHTLTQALFATVSSIASGIVPITAEGGHASVVAGGRGGRHARHPRGASMDALLSRFSSFHHRLQADAMTQDAWTKVKQRLYRHPLQSASSGVKDS